jgi:hypothetical protein
VQESDKRLEIVNEKYEKHRAVDCLYGYIDVVAPIAHLVKQVINDSLEPPAPVDEQRLADLQTMYYTLCDHGAKSSLLTAA